MKTIFTFFDFCTLILFFFSFILLLILKVSIFDQAYYFMGFFWFPLLSVRSASVKKRFSLLQVLFLLNDWFTSKLNFMGQENPSFLLKLAFPFCVGFLILSFSIGKGTIYLLGLCLGGFINYLQDRLFTKKV